MQQSLAKQKEKGKQNEIREKEHIKTRENNSYTYDPTKQVQGKKILIGKMNNMRYGMYMKMRTVRRFILLIYFFSLLMRKRR